MTAFTFRQKHVGRLQVPVQNPLAVEVFDGGHELLHALLSPVLAQRSDLTTPSRKATAVRRGWGYVRVQRFNARSRLLTNITISPIYNY